jgi:hypothetical protein
MRRSLWLLLLVLFSAALPARATAASSDDFSADSCLGPASARTAVEQLGPVRTVVFDPVSNSFAFVAPCPEGTLSAEEEKNRQYLDRHRLALTTQKIRLLILPYNPLDGSLTLQDSRSQGGIEFSETPIASLPKQQDMKQTAVSSPGNAPSPKRPPVNTPPPTAPPSSSNSKSSKNSKKSAPPSPQSQAQAQPVMDLKVTVEQWIKTLEEVNGNMRSLQFKSSCVHDHLQEIPIHISRKLAMENSSPFSLAKDVTFNAVILEAKRRTQLITADPYESCFASRQSLDQDAEALEKSFLQVSQQVDKLGNTTDRISQIASKLVGTTPPSGISQADWAKQVVEYQQTATTFENHQKEIEAERKDLSLQIGNMRGDADNFKKILNSAAFQLQRHIYNPLASGESLTIVITRSEVKAADGKATVVSKQSNAVEIRSAPVYTIRFGTGIVVSGLRDPSFKTGTDPNDSSKKTILFDDQGQNQVLPALFVHHYWGRRSPLLKPTFFERFMPTFSLGIPLAKADLLQQVLFGLDWELVPGLELNLGAHWGKVNALNSPYHVGGPEIPSTLDVTTIQQKQFRTAFYAGIVLNSDSFTSFFGQQK